MANTHDHHEEENQSRPFLASSEAHEATLMKDSKTSSGNPHTASDEPAPMLPPLAHNSNTSATATEITSEESSEKSIPAINVVDREVFSQDDEPIVESEAASDTGTHYYPSSRKIAVGAAASLVALVGFSAVWFNVNQDIYTLSNAESNSNSSTEIANSTERPETTQPATLGAETGGKKAITMKLANLPALEQGFYHLWITQNDSIELLGKFDIDDNGQAVGVDNKPFKPEVNLGQSELELLVSIESGENPEQPSTTIILSGALKDGQAKLTFTAINLADASGVFTIAAPTDLSGENQSSGIWLAKTDGHTLTAAGLQSPTAPAGWKYEAQLSFKDQIIAAGRFSNPNDRDDFGVFTPNPDRTPNYPGEDYLQGAPSRLGVDFPANLTSGEWKLIISIEPDQNGTDPTGDEIFFLQPFMANIAKDTPNFTEQPLKADLSKFPTATISLK